jgi:hypothetical protein
MDSGQKWRVEGIIYPTDGRDKSNGVYYRWHAIPPEDEDAHSYAPPDDRYCKTWNEAYSHARDRADSAVRRRLINDWVYRHRDFILAQIKLESPA